MKPNKINVARLKYLLNLPLSKCVSNSWGNVLSKVQVLFIQITLLWVDAIILCAFVSALRKVKIVAGHTDYHKSVCLCLWVKSCNNISNKLKSEFKSAYNIDGNEQHGGACYDLNTVHVERKSRGELIIINSVVRVYL